MFQPMITGIQTGTADIRSDGARWSWVILCLFLGFCAFISLNAPVSAKASEIDSQFVIASIDPHSDCDQSHSDVSGHCHHASTACFAFAQATSSSVPFDVLSADHPNAASPEALSSRSLPPNLRPPKRSIQA
jgi:hypothetical protein